MRGGRRIDTGSVQQLKEPINFQSLREVNTAVPTEGRGDSLGFSGSTGFR